MKGTYAVAASAFVALGANGFATPASAEQAASNGAGLEEVIVTAQKRAERLQDVPVSMTVVGASQLQDEHVTTMADLARTTPALEMIQTFGGPGGGGQIRGIGTQSFSRTAEGAVGVVVDGVSQGNVNVNNIFDTAQVEVLRGPQGTLFGLTSSAGVINMTTNAPNPAKFESIWHVDLAGHGMAGSEFGQETLHGVVNIPISADSALRIAGSVDDYRGVQHNNFTGRDDHSENYGARARYLLKTDSDFTLNVIADYQRLAAHGAQGGANPSFTYVTADPYLTGLLAQCGITAGWDNQNRCGAHPTLALETNYGLSAQMDWSLGNNTLTSISAYRRDVSGPNVGDIEALPTWSPQLWTSGGGLGASRLFSEELRISSKAGGKVDYTAGAFYSNFLALTYYVPGSFFHIGVQATPYFQPVPGVTLPTGTPLLDVGSKQTALTQTTNTATSIFGQLTYHGTDKLAFIVGARLQRQSISDYNSPLGYMPGVPGDTGANPAVGTSQSENNLSGKVGVQYKLTPDWTGYTTLTRGYKGFQAVAATTTTPALVIPSEIPLSFEIGLKGDAFDHKLGVDVNFFDTHVQDYQGQTCSIANVGVLVCLPNSFNVTSKGLELDLYGHPLKNLSLNGGFIYNVASYPGWYTGENPENLTGGDLPGSPSGLPMGGYQLVGVPKVKLTLSGDYTIPLGAVSAVIGSDVVYKSDVRGGYSPDPRFVYPAHWMFGLRVGIRSADGRWGVTAFGRDLNNAHEPLTMFGGPAFFSPATGPSAFPPFSNPAYPNGHLAGVSGWIGSQSLREVGLSFDLKF